MKSKNKTLKKPKIQFTIHQVFLDIGLKPLSERTDWLENMEKNKKKNPHVRFKLWTDKEVNKLIDDEYPQYKKMIRSFPHKFYLIDFCRYLILNKYGGMYMDLDVYCKKKLPDSVILGQDNKPAVNNNIIKLKNEDYKKLLDFCVSEYKRIADENLYSKWKGRHLLNSVGAYMFKRFCRNNDIKSSIKFKDYFIDAESRSWIQAGVVGR